MPNSLIFVVILAVWAAYLIQHWIRRRDHVATAKSVDRFSEAMRVLERRQSMPRADVSTPAPRSYAVSLMRPAHPEVVVKRAHHGDAPARERSAANRRVSAPSIAMLRGVALVLGFLVMIAGVTASVLRVIDWWGAALGVAALLLALTFVRFSVGSTQRRRTSPVRAGHQPAARAAERTQRATRPGARPAAARSSRPARAESGRATSGRQRPVRTGPAPARPAVPVADQGELAAAVTVAPAPAARVTELYDVAAVEGTPQSAPLAPEGAPELAPTVVLESTTEVAAGSWAPVPVPPPTYTLKARADRGGVAPRTESTPVADLPFDGNALAFDEEFEDLPAVHRVV